LIRLLNPSSAILLVTGSAVGAIQVHAAWKINGTGKSQSSNITTATTTTIISSPLNNDSIEIENIFVKNTSAVSCAIQLQHYDGTNTIILFSLTLAAGESVVLDQSRYQYYDPSGRPYSSAATISFSGSYAGPVKFTQSTPAGTWSILHGLSYTPIVEIFLNTGEQVFPDLTVTSSNITAVFATATAGYALAS
jgi:hypothetical protein